MKTLLKRLFCLDKVQKIKDLEQEVQRLKRLILLKDSIINESLRSKSCK